MRDSLISPATAPWTGVAAVLLSLLSQNIGASFAKQLFQTVGAGGMTALRVGLAAALLMLLRRAWRRPPKRSHLRLVLPYGAMLGLMNLLIYQAFARIPIGIAVAIEVLGPLAVVLAGARRASDLLWLATAVAGLALLLPLDGAPSVLDPVGVACAIGAAIAWALYILAGKRASALAGVDTVSWGMLVAALLSLPFALDADGSRLLAPPVLLLGLGVAALSSALPYTLEMWALRRLPASLFGVLLGSAPAMAALAGYVILDERLSALQWLAIALIMFAVAGSTLRSANAAAA